MIEEILVLVQALERRVRVLEQRNQLLYVHLAWLLTCMYNMAVVVAA